jgi:monoamine oxidase
MANPDVVIIGAGLAGAAAALALSKRNLETVILEGGDRLGGRGYMRAFADTEIELDFGGAWITPWQHRIRRLCREHGIVLRPRAPITERRWFRDGALHRDGATSAADRAAHERAIARIAADAMLLKHGHAQDEQGRDLAGISFADYLDRIAAPQATRDLLGAWWTVSGNGDKHRVPASELLSSSAYAGGLAEGMADVWAETLVGGVTALASRMVDKSKAHSGIQWAARSVTTTDKSVTVTAEDGMSVTARAAILAIGLNPMRMIRFDPALPHPKAGAIRIGHLGRAVKVWAKVTGVPVGVLATGGGGGIEWMFAERATEDGATLLVGFGVAANGWSPDLPRDIRSAVARFFPEAELLAWDWHDWNGDPLALGTWTAATVGASQAVAASTWSRHGPLAFASSDFAPDQAGWFEGAIASGEAAAAEILTFLDEPSLDPVVGLR